MSLFKSIFNKPVADEPYKGLPENEHLLNLISAWYKDPNDNTYKQAVKELMDGGPTLLLPSINEIKGAATGWQTSGPDTSLKLTCVNEIDGLKVLSAFTDEEALLNWGQNGSGYVALKSNDVLLLCEQNGINRLVINSNNYNMFVMERSRSEVKPHDIPDGTTVTVGPPPRPLPKRIIEKIKSGFAANGNVTAAYQYVSSYNAEFSLVIGVEMVLDSEEARSSVLFLVQDAIRGEDLEQPLDIFFITDGSWLQNIRRIEGANFYNK